MGQFLRALVQKDRETRERLRAELVRTAWDDASGVLDGAFIEVVTLRFGPGTKSREISKFTYRMVRHYRTKELSMPDVETMIRWGIGEETSADRVPADAAEKSRCWWCLPLPKNSALPRTR